MPPFGFNAPITEGFVAFAIPTLDKLSFHIQRSELTSSMDYKHTKTQQLTNAPTHQLKKINPQTQNSSTHQLKKINPQTQKLINSKTKKLINSKTKKIINPKNQKLINPQTYQPINSKTQKIINSKTKKIINQKKSQAHQPTNSKTQKLKLLFFILQQRSIFRTILAKIWGKK